jgi:DNA modification methylase
MAEINFYNIDCIEFMKTKPDNYYDLAIVISKYFCIFISN